MLSDATLRTFVDLGIVQFGSFTLKSGDQSPIYLDMRRLISHPSTLQAVAEAMHQTCASLTYDRVAGIPTAGLPLGTALSLVSGTPMIYPRMGAKSYGTGRSIEGIYQPGERTLLVDDVISGADSKREAIHVIESAGLIAQHVVVVVDRDMGGVDALTAEGYQVSALIGLRDLLNRLHKSDLVSSEDYQAVLDWLGTFND